MDCEDNEKKNPKGAAHQFSRGDGKEEERRKKNTVEVIHVSSKNSMENQCAQQ